MYLLHLPTTTIISSCSIVLFNQRFKNRRSYSYLKKTRTDKSNYKPVSICKIVQRFIKDVSTAKYMVLLMEFSQNSNVNLGKITVSSSVSF